MADAYYIVHGANANDSCIVRLKEDFEIQRRLLCDGKLFHVKCIPYHEFVSLGYGGYNKTSNRQCSREWNF